MWRKALIIGTAVFVFAGASVFWYVKSQSFMETAAVMLSEEATKALHTEIEIGKISVRSLTEISVDDVVVYDKTGETLAAAERVNVRFSPLGMVSGASVLQSISAVEVEGSNISLTQRENGTWNYQDLISSEPQPPNAFRGEVRLSGAELTVRVQDKSFILEQLQGGLDFSAQPAIAFKAEFLHKSGQAAVSGTWGGKDPALSIKAGNCAIEDYLDFLPTDMAVTLRQGLLKSLDVTLRKVNGDYRVSGEATVLDMAVDVEGTAIEQIDGLLLFNEKELRVFSRGLVKDQPIVLRGTASLDVVEPILDLQISSKGLDASEILTTFPLRGKVAFTANVSGKYSDPVIAGTFDAMAAEAYGYNLQNIHTKLRFAQGVLTAEEFAAELSGGKLKGQGWIVAADETYQFRLQTEELPAEAFAAYAPGLSGRIKADLVADGRGMDGNAATIYGSAAIEGGSYRDVSFTRLNANFYKKAAAVDIDYVSLILPQGEIGAEGKLRGDQLDLRFFGSQVDLAELAKFEPKLRLSGFADFSGEIAGTLSQPEIHAAISAADGEFFEQPYQSAQGSVAVANQRVVIEQFVFKNGATEHRLSGMAELSGAKKVDLQFDSTKARAEDIIKLALPGEKLTGNIDNTLHITGSFDDLSAVGEVDFSEGSFRTVFLTKAGGKYQWHNGRLELKGFTVSSPNLKVRLSGVLAENQALDFAIIADDINFGKLRLNLPYPVAGMGKFIGRLSGNVDAPQFAGTLMADELTFNGQKLQAVNGVIEYKDRAVELTSFEFKQGDGTFSLTTGMNLDTEKIYGNFSVEKGSLAAIMALFNLRNEWIDGTLDGEVRLAGTVENPQMHLTGSMEKGNLKDYPLRNIAMDIILKEKVITVKTFRAEQGAGFLAVQGSVDLAGPIKLECAGQDIDAGLITNLADSKVAAKGLLNFGGQIGGTITDPQANLSVDIQGGGVDNATFDTLYGLFNLKDGIIQVEQLLAQKGDYKASAYGVIPLAAIVPNDQDNTVIRDQMNLRISLDQADLSILPFLTKEVEWAIGETKGGVTITGTLAHPLIDGEILLNSGAIKFSALGKPLQDVALDVRFHGDRLELKNFQGAMGSGSFGMSGTSYIGGSGLTGYQFTLDLNKLEVVNKYYTGPLEGQITLTEDTIFQKIVPKVAGSLNFENCTIDIPALPQSEEEMPRVKLDLDIDLGKKVRLYNSFLYDIWLEGHVEFEGSTRRPQASGEISAIRGTVNYLKTPFKIKEANAYFNQVNSFLPSLHLEADTRLQRTRVYMQIDGPADKLQIRLNSDPEMNETEILSLLTLRSRYYDKSSGDGGIGKDELTALLDIGLQMSFLSEVEDIMRGALGVDEFKVVRDTLTGSQSDRTMDKEVYNVEIGKYVDDKLMLRYVQGVDSDTYKFGIRYEFNSRISLTSDVDQDSNSTIGIEARFKF